MPYLIATSKPKPDASQYGPSELETFPRLTRATYRTMFGEQAPPWDRAQRIKRWFDSSVAGYSPDALVTYATVAKGPDGKPGLIPFVLSAREAGSVNLPGRYDYPKYTLPPSKAFVNVYDNSGNVIGRNIIPPEELATWEEAEELRADLAGVNIAAVDVTENQYGGPYAVIYPPDESRRMLTVVLASGAAHSVQRLLCQRNALGVGSPGRWEPILSSDSIQWISEIPQETGEFDPRPEVPIPCRDLEPGEEFVLGFAGLIAIRRTDTPGGQALSDEKAMPGNVAEILKRVIQLQKRIGG